MYRLYVIDPDLGLGLSEGYREWFPTKALIEREEE
jgi:hypothetical protein